MSTTLARRLLARPSFKSSIQSSLSPARTSPVTTATAAAGAGRPFSSTAQRAADPPSNKPKSNTSTVASSLFNRPPSQSASAASRVGVPIDNQRVSPGAFAMANLSRVLGPAPADGEPSIASLTNELAGRRQEEEEEPYHFHVYAHRHNTHVTVTKPNREAIISLSCGNIGFKKGRRKNYDAAYQLTVYVLERLYDAGWDRTIKKMEVVLRGFGQGREAATKVLLGTEGTRLRGKIVRVADSTRLKFGGTRSPNPRRL